MFPSVFRPGFRDEMARSEQQRAPIGESTAHISANDLMWESFQGRPMKPAAESKL